MSVEPNAAATDSSAPSGRRTITLNESAASTVRRSEQVNGTSIVPSTFIFRINPVIKNAIKSAVEKEPLMAALNPQPVVRIIPQIPPTVPAEQPSSAVAREGVGDHLDDFDKNPVVSAEESATADIQADAECVSAEESATADIRTDAECPRIAEMPNIPTIEPFNVRDDNSVSAVESVHADELIIAEDSVRTNELVNAEESVRTDECVNNAEESIEADEAEESIKKRQRPPESTISSDDCNNNDIHGRKRRCIDHASLTKDRTIEELKKMIKETYTFKMMTCKCDCSNRQKELEQKLAESEEKYKQLIKIAGRFHQRLIELKDQTRRLPEMSSVGTQFSEDDAKASVSSRKSTYVQRTIAPASAKIECSTSANVIDNDDCILEYARISSAATTSTARSQYIAPSKVGFTNLPNNNVSIVSNNMASMPNNLFSLPNNLISGPNNYTVCTGPNNNFVSGPNSVVKVSNNLLTAPNNFATAPNNILAAPNILAPAPNSFNGFFSSPRFLNSVPLAVPQQLHGSPSFGPPVMKRAPLTTGPVNSSGYPHPQQNLQPASPTIGRTAATTNGHAMITAQPRIASQLPQPVLSWSRMQGYAVQLMWDHEPASFRISAYHLFAYQRQVEHERDRWKQIGEIDPLPLPMACTLTELNANEKYVFAICGVDDKGRSGPLSMPCEIHFISTRKPC